LADSENYKEAEYITEQVSGNQVEGSEKVEQTAEEVDQISQKTRENKIVHKLCTDKHLTLSVDINNEGVSDNNEMCVEEDTDNTEPNIDNDLQYALELLESVLTAPVQQRVQEKMTAYSDRVRQESRTARLWLHYTEMVELLRTFIKAE